MSQLSRWAVAVFEALLVGAAFGFGIWLLLRGFNPEQPSLSERIGNLTVGDVGPEFADESFDGLRRRLAMWALETAKGDKLDAVRADCAVTRTPIDVFAIDKLNAAVGGGLLIGGLAWWFGIASTVVGMVVLVLAGGALSYTLPDLDLRKRAAQSRVEFERALSAFIGLVAVSMTGGGGLNTALADSVQIGRGWVFEAIESALTDGALSGESAWSSLDRLGQRMGVEGLIELAGALGLAGDSGARLTETLLARAESARKREVSEARELAERTSANLGIPVATMLFGWLGFVGYPAVANLIQGLA